ncbi:MAG: DNA glycosylase [Eubacteriales bacterium]|nr:DNA glycosylase [Eubacteriales bacterium]
MKDYIVNNVKDFDLKETLECGQCFHFNKIDEEEYVLTAYNRLLHIRQEDNTLIFYNTAEQEYNSLWRKYFDLERDYGLIKESLLKSDEKLWEAISAMQGVRILNQDFFETLISFIISQNKQIPHIKKIVADISEKYGDFKGEVAGIPMYSFPSVEQLNDAGIQELKDLKTGFRAPYIRNAVDMVYKGDISVKTFQNMNCEQCIDELCRIKGVGSKVASCVSLFSLGKRDSFPVDVWIKRIMEHMYFDGADTPKDVIAEFAKKQYGELGGYAQQYLFYYGKTVKMGLKKK